MSELKAATGGAVHLLVIFGLSRLVDPPVAALVPDGGELLQEAISIFVTAFGVGLAEAFLWGNPTISIEWSEYRRRENLARIDLHVSDEVREGAVLKLVARAHAEKPIARLFLAYVAKRALTLQVLPKHAPVIFTVETSSRASDERPLAFVRPGAKGVDLILAGDPPSRGGTWVWVKGRFTAREVLPGEAWDVDYKLVCSSFVSTAFAKLLSVRGDVDKLTIQSL